MAAASSSANAPGPHTVMVPPHKVLLCLTTDETKIIETDSYVIRQSGLLRDMLSEELGLQETDKPMPVGDQFLTLPLLQILINWMSQHKDDPIHLKKKDKKGAGAAAAAAATEDDSDDSDDEDEKEERGGVKKIDIPDWDDKFIQEPGSMDTVKELMMAANFFQIDRLFDFCGQYIARAINQCKSVEEIRELMKIKNDFTPEEEAELKKQNAWAEDL